MIKEIVTDAEALSAPAQPATIDDVSVAIDLLDTMASLENAASLAANQIGSDKAVIAYLDEQDSPHVMMNPKILRALGPYKAEESCFSHEAISKVTRFARIEVSYDEVPEALLHPADEAAPADAQLVRRKKRLEGWEAELVQHGIDHCKGKLV
uniref:Formylmethionine deformylase n=1 Tax=Muribaculaceae bacterium Z82 TaxID=2304548 RepID=A0A7C9JRF1_9BACT